jgi:hypothetical protein
MKPSATAPDSRARLSVIPALMGIGHFLAHLLTNGNYGMFRDEFYYIACSNHPALGYVDHPPLSIWLLGAQRALLGDSVHAVRMLPAICGAFLVFLAGLIARELGGRPFAQAFAALCVAIAPNYLVMTGLFSMNAFDLLFWSLLFYLVLRLIKGGSPRLWLLFGLVLGLGALNKVSVLILGFGIVVSLLLTSHRRHLRGKHFWIGALTALLVFLPHILWQVSNEWPTLEFIENAKTYKITPLNPFQFFLGQVLENHPFNFPIWLTGLIFLLVAKKLRPYRLVGLAYIITFIVLVAQRSKVYYLSPAYPVLLAAGAFAIEDFLDKVGWRWGKVTILAVLAAGGVVIAPMGLPILPPENLVAFQEHIGLKPPPAERSFTGELPQYFGDRFGWEHMTATVASVYQTLTPDEQANCVIITRNYGQAGAIDYYGARFGLPPAICGHNSYFLWGPGDATGEVVITVGFPFEDLIDDFETVTAGATIDSPFAMPYERNLPVHVCRGLKTPLKEVWPELKLYI